MIYTKLDLALQYILYMYIHTHKHACICDGMHAENIVYTHKTDMTVGGIIERNRIHIISNIAVHYVHKCSLEHNCSMQH